MQTAQCGLTRPLCLSKLDAVSWSIMKFANAYHAPELRRKISGNDKSENAINGGVENKLYEKLERRLRHHPSNPSTC